MELCKCNKMIHWTIVIRHEVMSDDVMREERWYGGSHVKYYYLEL